MMPPSKIKLFVGMEDKLMQTLPTDVQAKFEDMIGKGICSYLLNIHLYTCESNVLIYI